MEEGKEAEGEKGGGPHIEILSSRARVLRGWDHANFGTLRKLQ